MFSPLHSLAKHEMLGQTEPWEGFDWRGITLKVRRGQRLEKGTISTRLYGIMELCWKENPEDRPSFAKLSKLLKDLAEPSSSSSSPSAPSSPTVPQKMDVEGVCKWIKNLGLTKDYSEIIQANGIDGDALKFMTSKQHWNEIGITAYGDVLKILAEIPKITS